MSKSKRKNKKEINKAQNKKAYILNKDFGEPGAKKEGEFLELKFTPQGKQRMNNIRQRMSAKVFTDVESVKETAIRAYDPDDFIKMLDEVEPLVKNGKYKKAVKATDTSLLNGFLTEYDKLNNDDPTWEKMNAIAKRVITIGKSFFEYCADQDLEFIPDNSYDGLLAKFLKQDGAVEPMGIVPKGLKNQKKVDIKYQSLHNNMDKAYILMSDDVVPEGVKETDSIESFLWRVYKALGFEANQEIELELSPKIDGVSINATLNGTAIQDPQTRGDKEESIAILGLDNTVITKNDLGLDKFGIQYEAFVTDKDRAEVSKYLDMDKPYVSNRHAASGIIHRLSTAEDDDLINFLSFYPINSEGLEGTYAERIDMIQNFGLVPKDMIERKIIKGNFNDLIKQIRKAYDKLIHKRAKLSYAIDGMVITIVDDDFQKKVGRNGRTNKYQIAYKFDPATAIGVVKGIHLDTGKKGYRTVQVDLEEPVYIDGVQYPHIPVATARMFEELDLRKGDKVQIHRVGDVIPAMTVIEQGEGKKIKAPETCPDCGSVLIIHKKRYYCDNPECSGNIAGRFVNFFEKMGLEGYGVSFAEMLHNDLKCNNLADVLELTEKTIKDAGITSKNALEFPDSLKQAISKKHDYEVLGAMGIPGVAAEKAKIILDEIAMKDFIAVHGNLIDRVATMAVGTNQAYLVANYLATDTFRKELKAVNKYITKHGVKKDRLRVGHTGGDLDEKTREICELNDFEIVDGNNFDILITQDLESDSAKMKRARKKGLPVYLEWRFWERYKINLMNPETVVEQMMEHKILVPGGNYNRESVIVFILQMLEAIARTVIVNLSKDKTETPV